MVVTYQDPMISYEKVTNRRKVSQVHYHSQHELYYLVSGDTKYIVGDDIFYLKSGDFIFIPKEIIHKTDSESCLHNERILLSFEDSIFDDATRQLLYELSVCKLIHIPAGKANLAKELLNKLLVEAEREDIYKETFMKLYILELLTFLCRHRYDHTPQVSESEKLINEVAEYIRRNFSQDLSLAALSKHFSISGSCLSRKFKAVTGMGINEYITSVRIHNAEQLLSKGDLTIMQVSERCGYGDSNYFASVFKRIKGTTPLKFSKSQIQL